MPSKKGIADWVMKQLSRGLSKDDTIYSYGITAFDDKSTGEQFVRIQLKLQAGKTISIDPKTFLLRKVPSLMKTSDRLIIIILENTSPIYLPSINFN